MPLKSDFYHNLKSHLIFLWGVMGSVWEQPFLVADHPRAYYVGQAGLKFLVILLLNLLCTGITDICHCAQL